MGIRRVQSYTAVAVVAAAGLAMAAPAGAKTPVAFTTYKVGKLPGTPAKFNKVFVTKYGSSKAKKVLVLIPGTNGGAGNFSIVGPELARRVPGLQVWALDRREQALEDTSLMKKAAAGKATAKQLLEYYLPLQPKQEYKALEAKNYAYMKNWGMKMQVEDARVVIRQAAKGGRTVILGGHSLGASMAAAYATWDFNGKAGYKDIKGIVAIDGGLSSTPSARFDTKEKAEAELANLDPARNGPWLNLLGIPGFAWITGPFAEIGAFAARLDPRGPSVLQTYPLISAVPGLQPTEPVTNAASLGYAFDSKTSPANLRLIQVRSGELAPSGDPRGWVDKGITPVQNVARGFVSDRNGTNGADWYFPTRLSVDSGGAAGIDPDSPGAKVLGLRLYHLARVNVPYYAFQTSLSGESNGVIKSANSFAERSRVPKNGLVRVDRSKTTSHLDPLLAAPDKNDFIKTVVPFLKKIR